MSFPVFDLHCDTAFALLGKSLRECGSLRQNALHIDLERAGKLPGYAQCFACYTTSDSKVNPTLLFERELAAILWEIERNSDRIRMAYSAADVKKNYEAGYMSGILTLEGTAGIGFNPDMLEDLHKVGFRISTLGWNEKNELTGSNVTGGGLTELGREYVREAQRLGMIVDISHISDEGFWDIMDITQAPVIASHSNSRAVWNHSRNLTDDMFRAICRSGGVVGINQYVPFLGENADLDTVCDHIFHFMEMDPEAKHISLGADLDGCDELPTDFEGVQDYPKLAQRLKQRGLDNDMIENIYWNNAIGVMERCCM